MGQPHGADLSSIAFWTFFVAAISLWGCVGKFLLISLNFFLRLSVKCISLYVSIQVSPPCDRVAINAPFIGKLLSFTAHKQCLGRSTELWLHPSFIKMSSLAVLVWATVSVTAVTWTVLGSRSFFVDCPNFLSALAFKVTFTSMNGLGFGFFLVSIGCRFRCHVGFLLLHLVIAGVVYSWLLWKINFQPGRDWHCPLLYSLTRLYYSIPRKSGFHLWHDSPPPMKVIAYGYLGVYCTHNSCTFRYDFHCSCC